MNKKGFIFDLDGVIVDTAKYHFSAWKKLANGIGIDFTETQNEQLKGVSRVASLQKILSWGNTEVSPEEFTRLMTQKNDDYLSYIAQMDANEILPDVPKIINYLLDNNQGIALGSASKNATAILQKVQLLEPFQAIVDGNHVTKAKPDPEVFLKAAEALHVAPKDCIVFEDAVAGIQAAKSAQMIAIGIGEQEVLHEADYVFKDFTEISTDFIQQLIENK